MRDGTAGRGVGASVPLLSPSAKLFDPRPEPPSVTPVTSVQSEFVWPAHPARERPGAAVAALAIIALLALGATLLGQSPWWGGGAALLLVLALNRFFLPSRYAVDAEGITARYPLRTVRLPWSRVRRFVHDEHGGYLSSRARRSRFDAFRGVHLLFGADRDEAIARIQSCIEQVRRDG